MRYVLYVMATTAALPQGSVVEWLSKSRSTGNYRIWVQAKLLKQHKFKACILVHGESEPIWVNVASLRVPDEPVTMFPSWSVRY